jgi:hypothetical protein
MLEIVFIIFLARKIGEIIEPKGRKTGWYKFMLVALWIGGEFTGGVVAGLISIMAGSEMGMGLVYLLALVGAAMGAGIAFLIAKSVSPLQTEFTAPPPPPTFG